jgi:hypothetical protein
MVGFRSAKVRWENTLSRSERRPSQSQRRPTLRKYVGRALFRGAKGDQHRESALGEHSFAERKATNIAKVRWENTLSRSERRPSLLGQVGWLLVDLRRDVFQDITNGNNSVDFAFWIDDRNVSVAADIHPLESECDLGGGFEGLRIGRHEL